MFAVFIFRNSKWELTSPSSFSSSLSIISPSSWLLFVCWYVLSGWSLLLYITLRSEGLGNLCCAILLFSLYLSGLDGKANDEDIGGDKASLFWPLCSDNLWLCWSFADESVILPTAASLLCPLFWGRERLLGLLLLLLRWPTTVLRSSSTSSLLLLVVFKVTLLSLWPSLFLILALSHPRIIFVALK